MIPYTDRSIKKKLLAPILMFVALIFFSYQAFSYYTTFEREKANLIERVKVLATGVAYNLEAALLFEDDIAAKEILSAFSADSEVLRVKLYTIDGNHFATYQSLEQSIPTPTKLEGETIATQGFAISDNFIFLRVPIRLEDNIIAHLRVTISKAYFNDLQASTLKSGAIFLIILTASGTFLYLMVQRVIIRPIFGLNSAIQEFIYNGKFKKNDLIESEDEIGHLVRCFNTMTERLNQRAIEVQETLSSLKQEQAFIVEVIETVQHTLVVTDESGQIVLCNEAALTLFDCSEEELKRKKLLSVLTVNESSLLEKAVASQTLFTDQMFTTKDAYENEQFLQISAQPLAKPGMVLFAIQDITELELSARRQRIAAGIFENSQEGLLVMNQDNMITMVNPAMTEILGFEPEDLVNRKAYDVFDWKQYQAMQRTIAESILSYGQWKGEITENHKEGYQVPLSLQVRKINKDLEKNTFDLVLMFTDLTDMKEVKRLEYLAHHDSLTGLANRAKLYRVLDETIRLYHGRKGSYGVIYLDLDGFKQVNDVYGHDAGDEVLKQVSDRLSSGVRDNDLVARLAGDEFVVLLDPVDEEGMHTMCNRIINLVKENILYQGQALNVGASLGGYLGTGLDKSIDAVLKASDSAMYQAKMQSKGRYVLFGAEEKL